MALTTDQYQQLMRFLDADMSVEEMAAFEKELDAHPEMRAQLDLEHSVRTSLAGSTEGRLISLPATRKRIWIAAASIAAIAMLSAYLLFRAPEKGQQLVNNTDSTQVPKKDSLQRNLPPLVTTNTADRKKTDSLFKQFYNRPGPPASYPITLADAFDHFEKNNYVPIEKFDVNHLPAMRGSENENETIQVLAMFYKGIAALEQQKTDSAISLFQWIIAHHPANKWASKAHWYLAMAYLKNNHVESAVKELQSVKDDQQYGSNAARILNTLSH